jgi:hypothetical protein
VQGVRKNKGGRKRTANEAELDDEPANQGARQELVRLEDIEMVYSKRRKDKEAKMEAILKGKIQTRSRNFSLEKWPLILGAILAVLRSRSAEPTKSESNTDFGHLIVM